MKNTIAKSLLIVCFASALSGCSKKDAPAPEKKTNAQLIVSAAVWKLSKLELFDSNTASWVSEPLGGDFYYASFVDFTSISFKADGTLTLKGEGGGPNNSYSDTGTWSINGSVITITPTNEMVQTSTINTLTATTFVTSWAISKTGLSADGTGTAVNATQVRETFASGN